MFASSRLPLPRRPAPQKILANRCTSKDCFGGTGQEAKYCPNAEQLNRKHHTHLEQRQGPRQSLANDDDGETLRRLRAHSLGTLPLTKKVDVVHINV